MFHPARFQKFGIKKIQEYLWSNCAGSAKSNWDIYSANSIFFHEKVGPSHQKLTEKSPKIWIHWKLDKNE